MKLCREWLVTTITATISTLLIACSPTYEYGDGDRLTGKVDISYIWSLVRYDTKRIVNNISIRGTIVANDKLGELNKSIVLVDNSGGIEIAIDCDSINTQLPLFSDVEVVLSGLYVGRAGSKCLIGKEPTGGFVVDRIKRQDVNLYIRVVEQPHDIEAKHLCIGTIDEHYLLNYIAIDNVRFIDEEQGLQWCERDSITNRTETTIRHLTDGLDTLRVVVDKECRYSSTPLPIGDIDCYGILDYYKQDIALRIIDHQVLRPKH